MSEKQKATIRVGNPPTVDSINALWREMTESAVDYAIRIGSALTQVKKECQRERRRFGSMFAQSHGLADKRPDVFMFSQDTANKLMKIARNTAIKNSEHARNLPSDWTAIYEISRLPPTKITKLIEDGSIRPDMGRDRARVIAVANMPRKPKVIEHEPAPTLTPAPKSKQGPRVPAEELPDAPLSGFFDLAAGQQKAEASTPGLLTAAKSAFDELSEGEAHAFVEWMLDSYSLASMVEFRESVERRIGTHNIARAASDDVPPVSDASTLNKKEQKALDKALTQLQAEFEQSVAAEVEKRLADARERKLQAAQQQAKSAQELRDVWKGRVDSCKAFLHLFQDNWRTVASSIHPDRPERTKEQLENASAAMNKLKSAFERIALDKWGSA